LFDPLQIARFGRDATRSNALAGAKRFARSLASIALRVAPGVVLVAAAAWAGVLVGQLTN
jgi:hypothetical protein